MSWVCWEKENASHTLSSFGHRRGHFALVTTKSHETVPSKGDGKPERVLVKFFSGKTGMGNEGKEMRTNVAYLRLIMRIVMLRNYKIIYYHLAFKNKNKRIKFTC